MTREGASTRRRSSDLPLRVDSHGSMTRTYRTLLPTSNVLKAIKRRFIFIIVSEPKEERKINKVAVE
jgi:adenylate kinase